MRTSILATLLGLSLVACAGTIDGGGDDDVPANCGNGVVDSEDGETCDDNNTISGDGCSSTCTSEATPRLDVSVDKPTIATELGTTNMVTVTLTGADGFSGVVDLAASIVDGANAPLTGWQVVVNPASVTVPLNGTVSAVVTMAIPSDATLLEGNIRVDVSGASTSNILSTVTALNQLTYTLDVLDTGGGTFDCVYPVDATPIRIHAGTKVRFANKATAINKFEIHATTTAMPHQGQGAGADDPITEAGSAYERTLLGPATEFDWYCHDHGPDNANNPRIQVVVP